MKDVHHTIRVLADQIGLQSLDLGSEGFCEVVFDGTISVNFVAVSDTEMELSTRLPALDQTAVAAGLMAMMTANYHGHGTGAGRLAADPRDFSILYCERLDVTGLEAHTLEARIIQFLKYAAYWTDEGADMVRAAVEGAERASQPIEELPMIRL